MLQNTPFDKIKADSITCSMTKDVLKKISSEVKKSSRLHNDVMLELMLTQKVIQESSSHASFRGYPQHLQIDPFAVDLYTEGELNILVEYLRKTSPVPLYLDVIAQKIADQNKEQLDRALVLPSMDKNSAPQPVKTANQFLPDHTLWHLNKNIKQNKTQKQ